MKLNRLLYQPDVEIYCWYDGIQLAICTEGELKYLALWLDYGDEYESYIFLPLTDDKLINKEIDLFSAFKSSQFMYFSNYIPSLDLYIVTVINGLPDSDLPEQGVYL